MCPGRTGGGRIGSGSVRSDPPKNKSLRFDPPRSAIRDPRPVDLRSTGVGGTLHVLRMFGSSDVRMFGSSDVQIIGCSDVVEGGGVPIWVFFSLLNFPLLSWLNMRPVIVHPGTSRRRTQACNRNKTQPANFEIVNL